MDDLLKSGVDIVEVIKPSSDNASAMWALGWVLLLVAVVTLVISIISGIINGIKDKKSSNIAVGVVLVIAGLLIGYMAIFSMGCAIRMANDVETQYEIYVPTEVMALDYAEMTFDSCFNIVEREEAKRKIGYLPENNPLYLDMYVKEYLQFVAEMYQLPNAQNEVKRMIECVGLENDFQKKIGQLSKGYRQRVGLAQALIHNPQVLILDEPTTGLDPNQLVGIRQLIRDLGKEKTVLFSTHIMQEVNAVCDRVMVINKGALASDNVDFESDGFQFVVEFETMPTNCNIFKNIEGVKNIIKASDNELEIEAEKDIRTDIFQLAMQEQLIIKTLKQKEQSMEDLFHQLTK